MTRLRERALAGVTVSADASMQRLAELLELHGARAAAERPAAVSPDDSRAGRYDADLDLLLTGIVAADGLDDAAGGRLALRLTQAFGTAREHVERIRPGGLILFVLWGCAPRPGGAASTAASALARSLALEWAPRGVRVDAIACANPESIVDEVGFLTSPASRMLTGAVVHAA